MDRTCRRKSYLADMSFTSIVCDLGSSANKAVQHGEPSWFVGISPINSTLCSRQSVLDNLPQNQQRQPQAARPQPQAGVRQAPNLFGFHQAGVQRQPENDALARVLGRFARNAARPPQAAPAQYPQAQGPPNTGTQGWAPGPTPGVVIQYNIQYQGQPPHGQVQVHPSSQLVPPFSGFVGPNRDWRPWDFDQRWLNRRGAQEPSTGGGGSQVTSQSQDISQKPAEAATQAALRRRGGHPTTSASFTSRSETIPVASSSNDTSTWSIPSLIPLDSSQTGEVLPPTFQQTVPNAIPNLYPSSLAVSPAQAPGTGLPSANPQPSSTHTHDRNSNHVTDAQLALLDRNTREAIDERIRILQGVSDTITHCLEDLVRVRSALPPPLSTASQFPPNTTSDVQCMFVLLRNYISLNRIVLSVDRCSQPSTVVFPEPEASTSPSSGESS